MPVTERSYVERRECARCGAEVREGKRRHFCGEPYPLKVCDEIIVRRYVPEAEVERLREAIEDARQFALLAPDDPAPDFEALEERMALALAGKGRSDG